MFLKIVICRFRFKQKYSRIGSILYLGHAWEAIRTMALEVGAYFADPTNRVQYIVDLRSYRKD